MTAGGEKMEVAATDAAAAGGGGGAWGRRQ